MAMEMIRPNLFGFNQWIRLEGPLSSPDYTHCGKAPDIVGLIAELKLLNSHPPLSVILCKLFKLIISHIMFPLAFALFTLYQYLK